MTKKLLAGVCALSVALLLAAPAYALDCVVAKKPTTAGAVGVIDGDDNFTPLKPNPGTEEHPHGGFIAFTDGEFSTSTFLHAPQGVLPPTRPGGSQYNCDGKGLDSIERCLGF